MTKRLYIAGPMRGHKLHNFPAFFRCELDLKNEFRVVNPATYDMAQGFDPTKPVELQENGFDLEQTFKNDFLQILLQCDGIVLLDGWDTSEGARAEFLLAQLCGLEIYEWCPNPVGSLRKLDEGVRVVTKVESPC